jgi:hypothetical protein
MRYEIPTAVHDWMAAHLAVVTYGEARDRGMTRHQIHRQVARGHWVEQEPEVYRAAGAPTSPEQTLYAGIRATGDRGAAYGETALLTLGVRTRAPATLELVVGSSALPLLRGVHVRRTRSLDALDVVTKGLLRMTSAPRTAVDLAGAYDIWRLLALLDELESWRRGTVARTHRRAQALRSGRAGVAGLADLTGSDAARRFRSWLERYGATLFRLGGLPAPLWNHRVYRRGRLLGIADAYWPNPAVAELDGAAFHSTPAQRQRDRARDRAFLRAGIPPFRYAYTELVQRAQDVVDELADVLGVRSAPVDRQQLARLHPLRIGAARDPRK